MDFKKATDQKPIPPHVQRHLFALRQSGKTVTSYCRESGISTWSIYDWKRRYGKKVSTPPAAVSPRTDLPSVGFAALGTFSTRSNPPVRFDIRLINGTSISVYEGTTAEELAPFLELIGSAGTSPC